MYKIRIGILGASNIAQKAIIPALIELPDFFNISGIATRSVEKVIGLAQQNGIDVFEGYNSILDKKYIDAVYIPLPNALHYEFVKLALNKGLHVLVEKSLASQYNEVQELIALAKNRNLLLMENFQFRFHSQLDFLLNTIKSEQLGQIRSLRTSFGFPPFSEKDNIRYKKELGGGALLDAGAYTCKVSQILLGQNLEVLAASLRTPSGSEVDIWGSAFLQSKDTGVCASLSFGFDHFYQCGVEIWCSKGKISTNRLFTAPAEFEPAFEIETTSGKEIITLPPDNHFKNMLLYFHKAINDHELQEIENQQNLDQSRLINEINKRAYE
jgi:NDP-hexose-3-ketoreductase